MNVKIDEKDKKVLRQLELNCRQPYSILGRKVGLSKEVVRYRIKRLEEEKVIDRYVTLLNATKIGHESYRWYLQLQNADSAKIKEIITYLQKDPHCIWVSTCTGRWDLIAVFSVASALQFEEVAKAFSYKYYPYILETQFAVALNVYFFKSKQFEGEKTGNVEIPHWGGEQAIPALEQEEIQVLTELCENPRQNVVDIARSQQLTVDVVRTRLERMEKNGLIQGTSITINYATLGLQTYKVFLNVKRINAEKDRMFLSYLRNHKNVADVIYCLGNWNLEVNVVMNNSVDYYNLMIEFKDRFPDQIQSYSSIQVFDNYKFNLFPMGRMLLKRK